MKIAVCGSASFAAEMKEAQKKLQLMGHEAVIPHAIGQFNLDYPDDASRLNARPDYLREIKPGLAAKHFDEIQKADAILVINMEKHGIPNYIGGATFSEIMMAQYWNKKIFFLNPIPEHEKLEFMKDELESVRPVVLNGNLGLIK